MNNNFLVSKYSNFIKGNISIPADKSISHRSLLFSAIASGETKIFNLLEGDDVLASLNAIKALGVKAIKNQDSSYSVFGKGLRGLEEPNSVIDCQNAGTLARLLLGLLSAQSFTSKMVGDLSLSKRPMKRVLKPLQKMGAVFNKDAFTSNELTLPITVYGVQTLAPLCYELEQASAQVKSAILLAGLYCKGEVEVVESVKTRDHSENMLKYLGLDISSVSVNNGNKITLNSKCQNFNAKDFYISSDFSSAAFFIVACLIAKNSEISLANININPLRSGLLNVLLRMGANIKVNNKQESMFIEEVADILVKSSKLKATRVNAKEIPLMIDEVPILCIAAAFAEGTTIIDGIAELRFKESNRVLSTIKGLNALGFNAYEEQDSIVVQGNSGFDIDKAAKIDAFNDHRIAMAFLIAGLKNKSNTIVKNTKEIATSFPNFIQTANSAGLKITKNRVCNGFN